MFPIHWPYSDCHYQRWKRPYIQSVSGHRAWHAGVWCLLFSGANGAQVQKIFEAASSLLIARRRASKRSSMSLKASAFFEYLLVPPT